MLDRKLSVFLLYASEDKPTVREFYQRLKSEGWLEPWLDEEDILGGQNWEIVISDAIESADAVIACFTQIFSVKDGYFQTELTRALKVGETKGPDKIFLIPIRLDDCERDPRITRIQWIDYFELQKENGYEKIIKSLRRREQEVAYAEEWTKANQQAKVQVTKYETHNEIIFVEEEQPSLIVLQNQEVGNVSGNKRTEWNKAAEIIFSILREPNGSKRIVYLEGVGGFGKTWLIWHILNKILDDKSNNYKTPTIYDQFQIAPLIIDFYLTKNWTLEGIRETIAQYLGEEHFAEYLKPGMDTQSIFRKCLQALVNQSPVLLAFDAFELTHNELLLDWLFDDSDNGLQMSGLVCLIGSRPVKYDNQTKVESLIENTSFVERIALSGFSFENAVEFYCRETGEEVNKLSDESKSFVKWLTERTEGNPLLIELIIDQARRDDSSDRSLIDRVENTTDIEVLKQVVMNDIKVKVAKTGFLEVKNIYHLDLAEYDTLLCMSYMSRRMDENILQSVINLGFIRRSEEDKSPLEIIDMLGHLFFVKVHLDGSLTIQLHDEIARMIRIYLFPDFSDDISRERRWEFQRAVLKLYDEMIQNEQKSEKNESDLRIKQSYQSKIAQLQTERLYYMLENGRTLQQELKFTEGLEQAYNYFVELKNANNEQLFKLLPQEMLRVIGDYPIKKQRDIFVGLTEIQLRLNNLAQAELYLIEAKKLSDTDAEWTSSL